MLNPVKPVGYTIKILFAGVQVCKTGKTAKWKDDSLKQERLGYNKL